MARRPAKGSGPKGGKLLAEVSANSASWPTGLTLLLGEDRYHVDRARKLLLSTWVPEEDREFALSIFADEKIDVSKVVASVRSVGMFAPRRVVWVPHAEILEGEPEPLIEYAKKPPANSFLLVCAGSLDKRRKLHKALAASGRTLEFSAIEDPRSLMQELATLAKAKKLKLDREAAAVLAEICQGDLYRVDSELEKLSLRIAEDPSQTVTVDLVRDVAAGSGMLSGWEVAEAILIRDRGGALAAARKLIADGEEPIRMLGGLSWSAGLLLQARAMKDAGAAPMDIIRRTRAWHVKDALLDGLQQYSMNELLAFPSELLRADRTLKSRSIDSQAVIESLVERLTAGVAGHP